VDDRDLQRNNLINGLVAAEHRGLYLNSATFHAQIEVMTQMLPIVVDALAVAATEEEARIAKLIKAQMKMPPLPIVISKEEAKAFGWEVPE